MTSVMAIAPGVGGLELALGARAAVTVRVRTRLPAPNMTSSSLSLRTKVMVTRLPSAMRSVRRIVPSTRIMKRKMRKSASQRWPSYSILENGRRRCGKPSSQRRRGDTCTAPARRAGHFRSGKLMVTDTTNSAITTSGQQQQWIPRWAVHSHPPVKHRTRVQAPGQPSESVTRCRGCHELVTPPHEQDEHAREDHLEVEEEVDLVRVRVRVRARARVRARVRVRVRARVRARAR
eukprot:scaffold53382_cov63-Phaeocystis_antarctica.AAC.2